MSLLKSSTKLAGEGTSQVNNVTKCIASSYSDKQGTTPNSLDTWILDSGATYHVCDSLSFFTAYREVHAIPVKLPNGNIVTTNIVGDINITSQITLKNVLYMPHFSFNLISVSRVSQDLGCVFAFTDTLCFIQNSMQKMIGSGRMINGLYYLEGTQSQVEIQTGKQCNSLAIPKTALWHFRLGHTSHKRLELLQKLYQNIEVNKVDFCCDICHLAKQRKLSYELSNSRASSCLELLHMDIWGPFSTPTPHGHKYFLKIVDDFSRFTWIILLKGKFETTSKIQNFILFSEEHFGHKVRYLRRDNGPEFLSLSKFYISKGILHQTSYVNTPQQNGRVERKHQCILNIARALMTQSHLPPRYWGYAVLHSVFIVNRVPSNAIKGQIPFTVLHNKLPDLSQLKVFGSLCYVSTQDNHMSKFDHRAKKCVYLGIKPGMKGYVALDLHNHEIIVSRNVIFEETIFCILIIHQNLWEYMVPPNDIHSSHIAPNTTTNDQETTNNPSTRQNNFPIEPFSHPEPSHTTSPSNHDQPSNSPTDCNQSHDSIPPTPTHSPEPSPTIPLRKSTRTSKLPSHLLDYHCNSMTHTTPYPISHFVSHDNLSPSYSTFCLSLLTDKEPESYAEASKHECWTKSMQTELNALANNNTWVIVDLPEGVKPIGSKWVYKIKRKADDTIDRYKARLVAKGYN
ncbi:peptide transporter PTR2 [Trifolium medium]|uniref:Peptide transporter PTR2 n=1 Tax=Trifolium medium TaxID=97028 RepID=A0A392LZU7_9FABA|nr:peptide transporter PTR2 [Trifolium medium]